MFAVEHYDIEPDIIMLGKGMGSGFPISAIGASPQQCLVLPRAVRRRLAISQFASRIFGGRIR